MSTVTGCPSALSLSYRRSSLSYRLSSCSWNSTTHLCSSGSDLRREILGWRFSKALNHLLDGLPFDSQDALPLNCGVDVA